MNAFQIESIDNVATALADLAPGTVKLTGDASAPELTAREPIPRGHKLATRGIAAGEDIVKYGVPVGRATRDIAKGGWVHLHCMRSNHDEASDDIDPVTGVHRATKYG